MILKKKGTSYRRFQNNGVAVRKIEIAEDQSITLYVPTARPSGSGASEERQVLFPFLFLSKSFLGDFLGFLGFAIVQCSEFA